MLGGLKVITYKSHNELSLFLATNNVYIWAGTYRVSKTLKVYETKQNTVTTTVCPTL